MPLTTVPEYERALSIYAKEIGVAELHIHKLIESHRRLRKLSGDDHATRLAEHAATRVEAEARAYAYALENDYVSLGRLRGMTLREIVVLLQQE